MIVQKNDEVKLISIGTLTIAIDDYHLHIRYPNVTYSYWKSLKPYENDVDIKWILSELLVNLDCTIVFSNQRLLTTDKMMYEIYISEYYYYMLHIEDQFLYNICFDMLIERHKDNVEFEKANPIIPYVPPVKAKKAAKKKAKGVYIRQVTTDMFSGKESYIYSNSTTGDSIPSEDPNLLDELNGVKTKVKKVKSAGVPMTNMTFSFKKKSND